MITVTKLNDKQIVINSDLIEVIDSNPDTTITMTTGRIIIAKEPVENIINKVVEHKRKIYTQF
ncbi:MAG: flagellar FlbD family protein [Clostridiales bacterium]|jgi:flagellar protein FlbD|nr:flagellar FlbD family protein [Clostridiales bacterium]